MGCSSHGDEAAAATVGSIVGPEFDHHTAPVAQNLLETAGQAHGLTDADAWPSLRSHLKLIAANGWDPGAVLGQAAALGGLETARDPAAVIEYRLDLTQANNRTHGPLPWLPGIPTQLLDNPDWGTYLRARHALAQQLAVQTLLTVDRETPAWARHLPGLDPNLLENIRLWRAAHNTPDSDLRPTGPTRYAPAEREAQRRLDDRLEAAHAGIQEWTPRIIEAVPDHPADALDYRITNFIKRAAARPSTWEAITPSDLARPRHPEPPPSRQPPDRSPGISF